MIKYRSDIDGLRALAVLSVVIFHLNSSFLPAGFIGVDIFFVISGYLITGILLKKRENTLSTLLNFYKSRFNRIVPAYLVMLVIVSVVGSLILTDNDYKYFNDSLMYAFSFTSNFYFQSAGDYFSPQFYEYPLLHTWSLSIEMIFYFIWPIIILSFKKKRKLLYVSGVLIVSSLIVVVYDKNYLPSNYYALPSRFTEIVIGSFSAIYEATTKRKVYYRLFTIAGFILILSSYFTITSQGYPGVWYLLPCLGTAFILIGQNIHSYRYINNILTNRIAVNIGKWSYSIYLWHWPVLAYTRYVTGKYELSFTITLAFFTVTLALSLLSYYLVESKKKLISGTGGLALTYFFLTYLTIFICASTLTEKVNAFISTRYIYSGEYAKYDDTGNICHGEINGSCLKGDIGSDKKILVIGDSHAAELNEFFNIYGRNTNTEFKILTSSSCIPITGFDYHKLPGWAQGSCKLITEQVNKNIKNYNTVIIAGMWSYQVKSPDFINELNNYLSSLHEKNIYIISQAPLLSNNLQRTLRLKYLNLPFNNDVEEEYSVANHEILQISLNKTYVKYIDTANFFNQLTNFPFIDNKPLYFDNSHLNMFGVKQMARYYTNERDFLK